MKMIRRGRDGDSEGKATRKPNTWSMAGLERLRISAVRRAAGVVCPAGVVVTNLLNDAGWIWTVRDVWLNGA